MRQTIFTLTAAMLLLVTIAMPPAFAEVSERFTNESKDAYLEFNSPDFGGQVNVRDVTENDGSGPVDASDVWYHIGTPSDTCTSREFPVADFEFSWSWNEAHVSFLAGPCGLVEVHWEAKPGPMDRNSHENLNFYSAYYGGNVHLVSNYQHMWATTSVTINGVDAGTNEPGLATISRSTYSRTVKPAAAP